MTSRLQEVLPGMAEVVIYTPPVLRLLRSALSLLGQKGVPYTEVEAGMDPDKRREMVERSGGRSTFPQIFIGGTHIGGCDEMMALERAGKLDPLLQAA